MNKGFTLIELILVITILGIVAITALPNFTNVTTQAELSSRESVLSAVQTGLALYRANDMTVNGPPGTYPAELDAQASNTPCAPSTPCFGNVLQAPVGDYKGGAGWIKLDGTHYMFDDGTNTTTFAYNPATGTFQQ